jgi:hypothetical protein
MTVIASPAFVGKVQPITFRQVVMTRASLADCGDDRGEIIIGQHYLGSLLRYLDALAAHGNPDIRPPERRGIIDAISRHGNDCAVRLKCLHQAQFVFGGRARENSRLFDRQTECLIIQGIQPIPSEDCIGRSRPSWRATAVAVAAWSPVIILTRIQAVKHSATAVMACSRGGSISPAKPIRTRSRSTSRNVRP